MKPMLYLLFIMLCTCMSTYSNAQPATTPSAKKYIKVPAGYLMVLRQGDDLFAEIENMAMQEKIPAANFTGMGFVNVTLGYFNKQSKQYEPKSFADVELVSMNGSIAWQHQKVSLHIHGMISDKTFAAYGGHMLGASVGTGSVEILVTLHDKVLQRVIEQPLGANVLHLE